MFFRVLGWSLRHRRWRHALNGIAMTVTVAIVIVFVSVLLDLVAIIGAASSGTLTRIVVLPRIQGPGAVGALPLALQQQLERIDGAKVVQGFYSFGGRRDAASYSVFGEQDSFLPNNQDIFPTDPRTADAWSKEPTGAIVTDVTANELGLKVGQTIDLPTNFGPVPIKVVGISYNAPVVTRVVLHFKYAREIVKDDNQLYYRVFCAAADYPRIAHEIVERTKNSPMPAQTINPITAVGGYIKQAAIVPAALGFLGVFLILVTALTLANSSALAIRERRVETATLRVVGYRPGMIVRLLLAEALMLAIAGALLAIGVTRVFAQGIQLLPESSGFAKPLAITPLAMLAGVAVALAIALVGALPSARAAVRAPLAEALRDAA